MEITLNRRATCRVCAGSNLRTVMDLGSLAVSDFVREQEPNFAPIELGICDVDQGGCGFVQLMHDGVDPAILYRQYWYRSGINDSMRADLLELAQTTQRVGNVSDGDVIVDIGANDGTLLSGYSVPRATRIGFDPALNLTATLQKNCEIAVAEFFSADAYRARLGERDAQAVTSIAMFYDLDDPHTFVEDVKSILAADGVWTIQMAYLPSMLETNNFDNLCHEHVAYYSLEVMHRLLDAHDLVIRDVAVNDVNGGSIRIYIQHKEAHGTWALQGAAGRIKDCAAIEAKWDVTRAETYTTFAETVAMIRADVRDFIRDQLRAGKRIHVYGASTKGNTILQYFGLGSQEIEAAADRNPDKWGMSTVATNIPIISEHDSRQGNPDLYLVLPWHFKDSFLRREQSYLESGGAMLFPLPNPVLARWTDGSIRLSPLGIRAAR